MIFCFSFLKGNTDNLKSKTKRHSGSFIGELVLRVNIVKG